MNRAIFLGTTHINYGVTVVLALREALALEYWTRLSLTQQLVLGVGFCTLGPVLFFRHSRGWRWSLLAHPMISVWTVARIMALNKKVYNAISRIRKKGPKRPPRPNLYKACRLH